MPPSNFEHEKINDAMTPQATGSVFVAEWSYLIEMRAGNAYYQTRKMHWKSFAQAAPDIYSISLHCGIVVLIVNLYADNCRSIQRNNFTCNFTCN